MMQQPPAPAPNNGVTDPELQQHQMPQQGPSPEEAMFTMLSFGQTFQRVLSLFFDRMDLFLTLSAIVLIPAIIMAITLIIFLVSLEIRDDIAWERQGQSFEPHHIPFLILVLLAQFFIYMLVTVAGKGAINLAVCEMYLQRANPQQARIIQWKNLLSRVWPVKFKLLQVTALIYLGIVVTALVPLIFISVAVSMANVFTITLASIVALVYVFGALHAYFGWSLIAPVIVVEGSTLHSVVQPLHRSFELVDSNRCYVICSLFSLWFFNSCFARLLHNLFVDPNNPLDVFMSVSGIVATVIPLIIFFPLHSIMEAVLYLNLRIARESMNYEVLSGELQQQNSAYGDGPTISIPDSMPNMSFLQGPTSGGGTNYRPPNTDYRHVPLMEDAHDVGSSPTQNRPLE